MKRTALAALVALTLVPCARATPRANYVSLPSPLAPLSLAPPIGGGATATTEGFRHTVAAQTLVDVALDATGTPFAVRATQRLDVGIQGDYFFTIGAPVLDVEAAPGSESTPGLRAASILWAGFNPGRRRLIARAKLEPGAVASSLPLRVEVAPGRVTLVNASAVTAGAFSADAVVPSLLTYLAQLKQTLALGRIPPSNGVYVTSKPVATSERIVAPLHVTGTVGSHAVNTILEGRLVLAGHGPVRLKVTPVGPDRLLSEPTAGRSGRQLLVRAARASLTVARMRQYETFLGNPDPAGANRTTYLYRTAARPVLPPAAVVAVSHRNWPATIAIAAGLLLAAAAALLVWSRS